MRVVVAVLGLCGHKAALTGLANHSSAKGAVRRGRWGREEEVGGGGTLTAVCGSSAVCGFSAVFLQTVKKLSVVLQH